MMPRGSSVGRVAAPPRMPRGSSEGASRGDTTTVFDEFCSLGPLAPSSRRTLQKHHQWPLFPLGHEYPRALRRLGSARRASLYRALLNATRVSRRRGPLYKERRRGLLPNSHRNKRRAARLDSARRGTAQRPASPRVFRAVSATPSRAAASTSGSACGRTCDSTRRDEDGTFGSDLPRRRVAATPRLPRGYSDTRRVAATPRLPRGYSVTRRVAATPRLPRGYSVETSPSSKAVAKARTARPPRDDSTISPPNTSARCFSSPTNSESSSAPVRTAAPAAPVTT